MEPQFWHQVWKNNSIGFHQTDFHPWLAKIVERQSSANLFVPLCGKSLDMWPLAAKYQRLIGAELSDIACRDFFSDAGITPQVITDAEHQCYWASSQHYNVSLLQGDFFTLRREQFEAAGGFDIFDRAALVALPPSMRQDYVQQLRRLFKHASLFIMTLEFDQNEISGPPFNLDHAMIKQYFGFAQSIELIASTPLADNIFAQRRLRVTSLAESLYQITW